MGKRTDEIFRSQSSPKTRISDIQGPPDPPRIKKDRTVTCPSCKNSSYCSQHVTDRGRIETYCQWCSFESVTDPAQRPPLQLVPDEAASECASSIAPTEGDGTDFWSPPASTQS